MIKAEFSASFLQFSESHGSSEIIIIYWFAAQETLIIISVENGLIFMWKLWNMFFRILWWIESSEEHNLFEMETCCNKYLYHFNVFLLNKNEKPVVCINIHFYICCSIWHYIWVNYIIIVFSIFMPYSIFKVQTYWLYKYIFVWRAVINTCHGLLISSQLCVISV